MTHSWWWRVLTPVVVLGCGALFVISAVNAQGTDLRPGRVSTLSDLVSSNADSYRSLESRVNNLQAQVDALTNAGPDADGEAGLAKVAKLRAPAGLQAVHGPGVAITLSDAPAELIDKTKLDPNLMVVHQQDIQAVVNALWRGGATAITIQGQRIVSTTGIKCSGSTIELQGVPYPEPYVIRAVGNSSALLNALSTDDYVNLYRQDAADPAIGIGWSLQTSGLVTAPAYKGLTTMNYATPIS